MQKFTAEEITYADLQADKNGTAIYIAVECGNLEIIELLINKKAASFTETVVKAAAGN